VEKGYRGLVEERVEIEPGGRVLLHKVNKGAGLGGNPYRDGSYDYYIGEKIVTNDPKGYAPFIMACVEMEFRN
jgi:unsaturated rhamnogalacturonyl hydrolase